MINILFILLLITCNLVTIFFFKKLVLLIPEFALSTLLTSLVHKEFYIAIASGCLAVVVYLFILHRMELSRMMPLLSALLTVATSLTGFFYFGESVTLLKVIALFAVTSGVILISL